MFRTALRNVLAHKARLLMTVLAVMLGVAFVSGTLVFTDTFGNAYKNKSAKSFDHVSVAVQGEGSSSYDGGGDDGEAKRPPRLTDAFLEKARDLPGAESAIGSVSGFTAVADKDGKLVGGEWGTTGSNFYPAENGKDPRYDFTEGAAPKSAADIALDSRTADRTGYEVGDTVRYSTDGPVRTAKVSGVFDTEDGSVLAGGSLVVFDNDTARKVLGKTEYDEIDLKAAAGTSETALKSAVEKILPKSTDAVTGTQLSDDQADMIEESTSSMSQVLLIFAGIALFVGIFIIANTFTMLVAQRTKELALMRAVGASRRQVTRSVLIEAFLVGLVAAVTGFVLGIGVAVGLESLMNSAGASLPDGPLVVAPTTIVVALLIGVVVTMLAAWLPGRRAAKIPPVAAMNSVHATPTTRGLVVRNTIGSIIVALGVVLLLNDDNYVMAGGAAVILVGVIILTPLLSRPFIAASAPLLKPFGVTGKLARLNSVRNPRRTASTAAALMIGLTLITAMTVVATSMSEAINKMAAGSLKADYTVSMANYQPLAPEIGEKLDKLPEVAASSPLRTAYGEVDGSYSQISGVDAEAFGELVSLDFTSGSLAGLQGDSVLVDRHTADEQHLKTGDTVAVRFEEDDKTAKLRIAGVYEQNEMITGLFTPLSVVDPHLSKITDEQVLVKMEDGTSAKAEDAIVKALGDNPAIKIQDKDAISNEIGGAINMMLNMLYGLLAMAILIAVLGVVNTLAMSVFERKHEIGMLRAIGLDRAKVKQMVRLESIVISLFGAVLGVGLGVFMGWAVGNSVADSVATYTMEVPVGRIALFLAIAALVGVLAAVWPARSAARLNPLMAIKAE
ncbi:ABC transporter permease [Streptomyces alfalfae]|uniref:ABC transporter n=1 Tax=Streptomyces alfalfae TaxID=1642299 RepID=A0ABN4VLW9_9ACTN|nr:ABC transporter permease [Streptomyces alfalfae]AYA18277.1 ABC transporter permease [Streptomyces fradiae]APY87902.1 ABC transporter [Streptomyces alfalfae]QUI32141.1 ABC transporter permease [Streptomyces alfalfae]RXX45453.1 ABC transporter permease [Streptomyces alfalfae]RZN04584.1 ABC transporter permease [Streptomyces alfalfae]